MIDKRKIRPFIRQALGDRLKTSGRGWDLYFCPFHEDTENASFIVYDEHCECKVCTPFHSSKGGWSNKGDVIDFIIAAEELHGGTCSMAEATAKLDGQIAIQSTPVRKASPSPRSFLPWEEIDSTRSPELRTKAMEYFTHRGLKAHSVDTHFLGSVSRVYGGHKVLYATIPNIAQGKVRKIKLRLQDEDAVRVVRTLSDDVVMPIRTAMAQRMKVEPDIVTDLQVAYHLFPRYTQVRNGIEGNLIYNLDRLIQKLPNGDLVFKRQSVLLIHEGEIKALAMEDAADQDDYGYPSIAAKEVASIAKALINVNRILIVGDREPNKTAPDGRVFNPGRDYAQNTLNAIGRSSGVEIIYPPEGYKDADRVVKAGLAHEWMKGYGVEPVKLR